MLNKQNIGFQQHIGYNPSGNRFLYTQLNIVVVLSEHVVGEIVLTSP